LVLRVICPKQTWLHPKNAIIKKIARRFMNNTARQDMGKRITTRTEANTLKTLLK
jgi:hypothetical protein